MCRARRGGPRTPSTTTDANLDCAFVENALFLPRSLTVKRQQNRIELVTRPTLAQRGVAVLTPMYINEYLVAGDEKPPVDEFLVEKFKEHWKKRQGSNRR